MIRIIMNILLKVVWYLTKLALRLALIITRILAQAVLDIVIVIFKLLVIDQLTKVIKVLV